MAIATNSHPPHLLVIANYRNIIKIPWGQFPSTWNIFRDLRRRRNHYQRIANPLNVLSFIATLLAVIVLWYPYTDYGRQIVLLGNIDVSLGLLLGAMLITTITLLIRKSQLYIRQLDDYEVSRTFNLYRVYLNFALIIVLFGLFLSVLQSSSISSLNLSSITTLVLQIAIVPLFSLAAYYLSVVQPLIKWAKNRVRAVSEDNELSEGQISKILLLILEKRKIVETQSLLKLIVRELGLDDTQIGQADITFILENGTMVKTVIEKIFKSLPQIVTITITILTNLDKLRALQP